MIVEACDCDFVSFCFFTFKFVNRCRWILNAWAYRIFLKRSKKLNGMWIKRSREFEILFLFFPFQKKFYRHAQKRIGWMKSRNTGASSVWISMTVYTRRIEHTYTHTHTHEHTRVLQNQIATTTTLIHLGWIPSDVRKQTNGIEFTYSIKNWNWTKKLECNFYLESVTYDSERNVQKRNLLPISLYVR